MKPSTKLQYSLIIKAWKHGIPSKDIVLKYNLPSIYVVYEALRFHRQEVILKQNCPKLPKIHQTVKRN